ncbi:DUF3419 domain-containing protein [Pseudooceanicola lipolyticus]|uniref:DUF3419 domain-containing protein n=1 Tax=Pseudooceanicola lipolyticus TaxID=2029104 RepID=A0A2M8IZK6_9RHOB|nr:DUF3419 family protein [Pseudooceanicola lipolyticus]PJE35970.1 DUF3419 domain-containing protein [Pseudooceanicola lipolyticus]
MSDATTISQQLGAAVHQNGVMNSTGVLERLFSHLFHGLVYPQIWEDPVVDMAALNLAPDEDLFCIASGGCNAMSYLTARPASVTAVDLSPAHVALLRLKAAAAQHLPDQAAFFEFFGQADRQDNVEAYDRYLAPHLDAQTRAYWEGRVLGRRRIAMFARGFYRYGALGRFIGVVHMIARLGGVNFTPLLKAQSLAAQRQFFDSQIAPLFEARAVKFLARRRAALFGLGIPPAQFDKLARDGGGDILPVLRERTRKLICDFPIAENYFAWQAFGRRYGGAGTALPPYLEPAQFDTVAHHAHCISVQNRPMTEVLTRRASGSLDCYVLLDAQDWMTDAQLNALWEQITRTARPGARVIYRTGGAPDILPGRVETSLLNRWRYDQAGSEAGFARDRSAIYGGFHLRRHEG